jgi:hypothetical protein
MLDEISDAALKSELRMGCALISQVLSIKSGSKEFHALKQGHDLHNINSIGKAKTKPSTSIKATIKERAKAKERTSKHELLKKAEFDLTDQTRERRKKESLFHPR